MTPDASFIDQRSLEPQCDYTSNQPALTKNLKWPKHLPKGQGIEIFSDGSKVSEQVGAVYVEFNNNTEIHSPRFRLNEHVSVLQAESFTLKEAAVWTGNTNFPSISFYTDSMRVLQALNKNGWQDFEFSLKEALFILFSSRQVYLFWQVGRLKLLYPMVNESETPLPRSWSPKDKFTYIGLSQNNLRVHYKESGKNHKYAASVRATHSIPAACGLYYSEVKIVSKGSDGYMGVGLSAQGVNMNRLPGWNKQSYGYHGDDGHSFCSSGTEQPYCPKFTTGHVIGCGVNFIDNTCFYTRNGHHLGIAFTDLAPNLYSTVGLQTPGEVVDENFDQSPFVFDIEDMMKELKRRTGLNIERFPVVDKQSEWQTTRHRIVQTYFVHHGYCAAAEVFAQSAGQAFTDDIKSIKNRQQVQKLVLAGRMGEAIQTTQNLYLGLLEQNPNLLFMLKCLRFP
ncbi:LOW QUALITY PROTEIN: ran-binding protein 9-like [Stegodyphus dumicola]|uniref:LOW QUALITY PROTEIN: ran-binding protein 9-like n=1 Tax=Stegodyphus dumicola TaxID=202533 RepID=UPI0015A8168F|nr:LOW QUALITY PROTEIN: ran-binding protein 9-like [Stegodyphus dumicola]